MYRINLYIVLCSMALHAQTLVSLWALPPDLRVLGSLNFYIFFISTKINASQPMNNMIINIQSKPSDSILKLFLKNIN